MLVVKTKSKVWTDRDEALLRIVNARVTPYIHVSDNFDTIVYSTLLFVPRPEQSLICLVGWAGKKIIHVLR